MNEKELDRFGNFLMRSVRDESISDWLMIINGQMKDEGSKKIRKMLSGFNDKQISAVLKLVPQIVDTTLHHLLWGIEQEDDIEITIKRGDGSKVNLSEVSDGLAGELYSVDGWIARFSKENSSL